MTGGGAGGIALEDREQQLEVTLGLTPPPRQPTPSRVSHPTSGVDPSGGTAVSAGRAHRAAPAPHCISFCSPLAMGSCLYSPPPNPTPCQEWAALPAYRRPVPDWGNGKPSSPSGLYPVAVRAAARASMAWTGCARSLGGAQTQGWERPEPGGKEAVVWLRRQGQAEGVYPGPRPQAKHPPLT